MRLPHDASHYLDGQVPLLNPPRGQRDLRQEPLDVIRAEHVWTKSSVFESSSVAVGGSRGWDYARRCMHAHTNARTHGGSEVEAVLCGAKAARKIDGGFACPLKAQF